jgi:hypothetical protein
MSAMAKAAPRTKQSKCPAPKELLKQRIEYKLCRYDDDVMEWHGGVVMKKYKGTPGLYNCVLDDGTAVVLPFEISTRGNVWRIVKPAAQPAAKLIASTAVPSKSYYDLLRRVNEHFSELNRVLHGESRSGEDGSSSSRSDEGASDDGGSDDSASDDGGSDEGGSGEEGDGNDGSAHAAASLAVFVAGKHRVALDGGNYDGTCMVGTPIVPALCTAQLRDPLVQTVANALSVDLRNCTTAQQRSACAIGAIEAVRKKAKAVRKNASSRSPNKDTSFYTSEQAERGAYERLVSAVGVEKAKHVLATMGAALCKISAGDLAQVAREVRAVNRPGAMGCSGVDALTFLDVWREALVNADFARVYEQFVGGEGAGRYSKWLPCHLQRFLARAAVVGLVLPEKELRALLILTGKPACVPAAAACCCCCCGLSLTNWLPPNPPNSLLLWQSPRPRDGHTRRTDH